MIDTIQFRKLLDACFTAKKITETMQDLPQGFKPRHMHVIGAISELNALQKEVRVSDVSGRLQITTPSVTKLINELEGFDVVAKYMLADDKRVTLLQLTQKGERYYAHYIKQYHALWLEAMGDVTVEEVELVTSIIERLLGTMPKMEGLDE